MANTTTLESLAELLPPDSRERFFAIASKFRNVPEDDDHLQMLEAVGFMMQTMVGVPTQIADLLNSAPQQLSTEDSAHLHSEIAAVLTQSLDTPSYKDLRDTVDAIRQQEGRFRKKVDDLHASLNDAVKSLCGSRRIVAGLWTGLVGGVCAALLVGALIVWDNWPHNMKSRLQAAAMPDAWVALGNQGMLDYLEMDSPELGGDVGLYLIDGDVRAAFVEGGRGVIAVGIIDPDHPARMAGQNR